MRSGEFVQLLSQVGVDVPALVERKVEEDFSDSSDPEITEFLIEALKRVDRRVQRSLVQNLIWWMKNGEHEVPAALTKRGEQLLRNLNGSKKTAG